MQVQRTASWRVLGTTAESDSCGRTKRFNFGKCVNTRLTPDITDSSVVIFDKAPYACAQVDKTPSQDAVAKKTIPWLRRRELPVVSVR